jgi:hypothetical protein
MDGTAWLINFRHDKGAAGTGDTVASAPEQAHTVLQILAPSILAHQASASIGAAWPNQRVRLYLYQ